MEAHRASYNSRKSAICPGVYAVVTNGICAAHVERNFCFLELEVLMLDYNDVKRIDCYFGSICYGVDLKESWKHIKTALDGAQKQSAAPLNTAMSAIKAVCESTNPHETDIKVLQGAINKIYAALTAS